MTRDTADPLREASSGSPEKSRDHQELDLDITLSLYQSLSLLSVSKLPSVLMLGWGRQEWWIPGHWVSTVGSVKIDLRYFSPCVPPILVFQRNLKCT